MKVSLTSNDRIRVSTNGDRMFADVSAANFQESLTIEFYSFAKQIIMKKDNTYKLFIFEKNQDETDFDYGFWNDGDIVWKSF